MSVHLLEPHVLDVGEARPECVPDMGAEHFRIADGRLDGEMFLERDLALHAVSLPVVFCRHHAMARPRLSARAPNKKAARRRLAEAFFAKARPDEDFR